MHVKSDGGIVDGCSTRMDRQAKHRARRSFLRAEGAASGVERDGDRSEQIIYAGGETLDEIHS